MIYVLAMILAFCSIVYELVIAQSLSVFLGNTVLRYCTTVGLYLGAMGIGAFLVRGRLRKTPAKYLVRVETLLSIVGGCCVVFLFIIDGLQMGSILFVVAHLLIIVIGVLTGLELPLLNELQHRDDRQMNIILGMNYIGAVAGAIVFAVMLSQSGLLAIAFGVGAINALCGVLIASKRGGGLGKSKWLVIASFSAATVLVGAFILARPIQEYLIAGYLAR